MAEISSADCSVLGKFPNAPANSWNDVLTAEDRAAYVRIHNTLKKIAEDQSAAISGELLPVVTSGFHEKGGVRGQRPKDLWCSLVNPDSDQFVRMPQLFIIASGRGIEMGFAAAIHRSDFSDQNVKKKLSEVIPTLFRLLPGPNDQVVTATSEMLKQSGGWSFRFKTRMSPDGNDFPDLESMLASLKSTAGEKRGAAAVVKHVALNALDNPSIGLASMFRQVTQTFLPIMRVIRDRYKFGIDELENNLLLKSLGIDTPAEIAASFNPDSIEDARKRILKNLTIRQGSGPFRMSLMLAYGGRCAVTQSSQHHTLEAAHIFPYKGLLTNDITNGLLLRSDIHTLFDLGLLKIGDDYRISIHEAISEPEYSALNGRLITLPENPMYLPSKASLSWHRNSVFPKPSGTAI